MPINVYRERDGVNKKKINIFFKLLKLLNMKTVEILIINLKGTNISKFHW